MFVSISVIYMETTNATVAAVELENEMMKVPIANLIAYKAALAERSRIALGMAACRAAAGHYNATGNVGGLLTVRRLVAKLTADATLVEAVIADLEDATGI